MSERPPLPPFTAESAALKVRRAEDAWNGRDPAAVALAYTEDSVWRNRAEFLTGREAIAAFLARKWARELDYRLIKELWAFTEDRIAVRFAYEWRDDSGSWFRSYGNENWAFDAHGLMARRIASINDLPIAAADRRFHRPAPVPPTIQGSATSASDAPRAGEPAGAAPTRRPAPGGRADRGRQREGSGRPTVTARSSRRSTTARGRISASVQPSRRPPRPRRTGAASCGRRSNATPPPPPEMTPLSAISGPSGAGGSLGGGAKPAGGSASGAGGGRRVAEKSGRSTIAA